MTVVNFNYPKFKYTIASTGQPGAGYKLFTYEEGTSTKKTTWTSLAKTAENTNPIILDANGECDVWIDGNYKFVLAPPTDTDPPTSPIWTYDAIRSEDSGTSLSSGTTNPINGSFETDDDGDSVPNSWSVTELSGGTIAIDATSSSHGLNSLKFTSTGSGGGTAATEDYYEVEAGKAVGVRFSIVSADVGTLNKVEINWYDNSKTFISTSTPYSEGAANPTTWTRKYTSSTAPATAKYAKLILTGVDAASTTHSSTNFDNIELDTSFTGEITADSSELNKLDGVTATTAEINYLGGVTSNLQTQLDFNATTSAIGRVELATDAEVQAGTDTGRVVTPASLASFDKSLVTNGYYELPGGLVIQWGTDTVGASSSLTVTLPVAFDTATLNVQATYNDTGNRGDAILASITSSTQIAIKNSTGTSASVFWVAIGH